MQSKSSISDTLIFILLTSYFLTSSVTVAEIKDQMGLHWFLLSILNLISGIFIIKYRKEFFELAINRIFKNLISILYFNFFILAGLSVFLALNKVEGFVIYSRLITTITSFLSISILLNRRLHLLNNFSIVIAVLLCIKCCSAISLFYSGLGKVSLSNLVMSLQDTEGNKNIFAAAIAIQIPLVLYGIFKHKNFLKYFCVFTLGLAFFTVIILNARASYLGVSLALVVFLIGMLIIHIKDKSLKSIYKNCGIILLTFAVAFYSSQRSLKKGAIGDSTTLENFEKRVSTITSKDDASANLRLAYWNKIIPAIEERPWTGVGYGNWKLYSMKYMNTVLDDNTFSKHPHNDFLEIAAETGIITSFIYFLIFVAAFFFIIKILFSDRKLEIKYISLFAFMGLCAYLVDASFNFPLERPHMQLLFVFVIVLLILCFTTEKTVSNDAQKISKQNNILIPVLIISLSVITSYTSYFVFKSMQAQFIVDNDLNSIDGKENELPQYKYDQVRKMFPSFPNIAENSETIGFKQAKYLRKEKRYAESIKLLDSVHKFSPYTVYDNYLKCNIYKDLGKFDSAYIYGKKAFYGKPRNFYYYRMTSYLASKQKDTTEIIKMFSLYNSYRKEEQAYSYYTQCLGWAGYDTNKLRIIVDRGLKLYPKDPELVKLKEYLKN